MVKTRKFSGFEGNSRDRDTERVEVLENPRCKAATSLFGVQLNCNVQ
jgi:hypothetical protein